MTILETMLKCDEGLRLAVYTDTGGFQTVGYGHKITPEDNINGVITLDEANALLGKDIDIAIHGVLNALPWVSLLDGVRQSVVYNLAFNLGVNGLLAFRHTLATLKAGDYDMTAKNMEASPWYNQVGIRAKKLCAIMASGEFPQDYVNFNPKGE